jgi:hypothetical protein
MRAVALLPVLAMLGCEDYFENTKDNATGEPVGLYALSADADMTSTCTEIINGAPRPWTFDVTLRRDDTKGFWISGGDPIEGTIDASGKLSFKRTLRVPVRAADKRLELGPCTILRTDDFAGALAGAPTTDSGKATFTGTLRYSYQIEPGSDCRDIVGSPGPENPSPMFAVLPFDARVAVSATRTGDPKTE